MGDHQQSDHDIHKLALESTDRSDINALIVRLKEIEMVSTTTTRALIDLRELPKIVLHQVALQLRMLLDKELATALVALVIAEDVEDVPNISLRTIHERQQLEYFTEESLAEEWLQLQPAGE